MLVYHPGLKRCFPDGLFGTHLVSLPPAAAPGCKRPPVCSASMPRDTDPTDGPGRWQLRGWCGCSAGAGSLQQEAAREGWTHVYTAAGVERAEGVGRRAVARRLGRRCERRLGLEAGVASRQVPRALCVGGMTGKRKGPRWSYAVSCARRVSFAKAYGRGIRRTVHSILIVGFG
jgi:hypothetical protein